MKTSMQAVREICNILEGMPNEQAFTVLGNVIAISTDDDTLDITLMVITSIAKAASELNSLYTCRVEGSA